MLQLYSYRFTAITREEAVVRPHWRILIDGPPHQWILKPEPVHLLCHWVLNLQWHMPQSWTNICHRLCIETWLSARCTTCCCMQLPMLYEHCVCISYTCQVMHLPQEAPVPQPLAACPRPKSSRTTPHEGPPAFPAHLVPCRLSPCYQRCACGRRRWCWGGLGQPYALHCQYCVEYILQSILMGNV